VIRKFTISITFFLLFVSGTALFCQDKSVDIIDLDFLIKAALENNPGLLDKQTSVEISEQWIQLSRSAILPQIDVNANTYLSNEYRNSEYYLSASTGISVSQMIWQNGRYRALIMQSEYALMADKWELEAERQELTLKVKLLYYDLLKYRSLYDISLQNVAQAKLFLEAAIEKKELGIGKESDILKARSDLGDAEYLVKSMHYSVINAENGLSRLIGESVSGKNIRTGPDLILSSNVFLANDSLYSMALNSYPELNAMMNLQLSQDYSVKAEEATRFPVFSANAGYNILSNTQIETPGIWSTGLTARWNVFDGYKRKSKIRTEKLQAQSLQYKKEDLLLELRREIDNRINALIVAKNQIQISESLKKSTSENLKVVEEEYKLGISSMLELSNAQVDDFEASIKLVEAVAGYRMAYALIERVVGAEL